MLSARCFAVVVLFFNIRSFTKKKERNNAPRNRRDHFAAVFFTVVFHVTPFRGLQ